MAPEAGDRGHRISSFAFSRPILAVARSRISLIHLVSSWSSRCFRRRNYGPFSSGSCLRKPPPSPCGNYKARHELPGAKAGPNREGRDIALKVARLACANGSPRTVRQSLRDIPIKDIGHTAAWPRLQYAVCVRPWPTTQAVSKPVACAMGPIFWFFWEFRGILNGRLERCGDAGHTGSALHMHCAPPGSPLRPSAKLL